MMAEHPPNRRPEPAGPWESHQVSEHAWVQRCDNPGPMTLEGTNTWIIAHPRTPAEVAIIDPGPTDADHLQAILSHLQASGAQVRLALLTHWHLDHSEGAGAFTEQTGVPVHGLADGLANGQVLTAGALRLQVVLTPGHTADSVCFLDLDEGTLYTGDTILGRGTTIVAHPDGALAPYLASLSRIAELIAQGKVRRLHPGHGPDLTDPAAVVRHYQQHRAERLEQVRMADAGLPVGLERDARVAAIVERVYADVPRQVWPAATRTVQAQLDYLAPEPGTGAVTPTE